MTPRIKCQECNIHDAKWVVVDMDPGNPKSDMIVSELSDMNYREGKCVCDWCKTNMKITHAMEDTSRIYHAPMNYALVTILSIILLSLIARFLYYS